MGKGGEEERDSKAKTQLRGELLRSTLLFARLLYNMEKRRGRDRVGVCQPIFLFSSALSVERIPEVKRTRFSTNTMYWFRYLLLMLSYFQQDWFQLYHVVKNRHQWMTIIISYPATTIQFGSNPNRNLSLQTSLVDPSSHVDNADPDPVLMITSKNNNSSENLSHSVHKNLRSLHNVYIYRLSSHNNDYI